MQFWTGRFFDLLRFQELKCRTKFHLLFIDKKMII
nr:MAG TPA: hypothetical protein [Caudoviricetes sp.]DAV46574.1 MAG TPA: hypothetical protein [Caudoviricetes sp.]DAZ73597.1 MAG TPA: hypothetical protein [Caudoviricetes sp.]